MNDFYYVGGSYKACTFSVSHSTLLLVSHTVVGRLLTIENHGIKTLVFAHQTSKKATTTQLNYISWKINSTLVVTPVDQTDIQKQLLEISILIEVDVGC